MVGWGGRSPRGGRGGPRAWRVAWRRIRGSGLGRVAGLPRGGLRWRRGQADGESDEDAEEGGGGEAGYEQCNARRGITAGEGEAKHAAAHILITSVKNRSASGRGTEPFTSASGRPPR